LKRGYIEAKWLEILLAAQQWRMEWMENENVQEEKLVETGVKLRGCELEEQV